MLVARTYCASGPLHVCRRSASLTQRFSAPHQPQSSLSAQSSHACSMPHATPLAEHERGIHSAAEHSSAAQSPELKPALREAQSPEC